jgi:hypothetical protein
MEKNAFKREDDERGKRNDLHINWKTRHSGKLPAAAAVSPLMPARNLLPDALCLQFCISRREGAMLMCVCADVPMHGPSLAPREERGAK